MIFNDKLKSTDHMQFGRFLHKVYEDSIFLPTLEEVRKVAEKERPKYKFKEKRDKEIESHLKNFFGFANKVRENVIATEQHMKFILLDEKGEEVVTLNPVIDLIIKGKTGRYLIVDYKSGSSRYEKNHFDMLKDTQMRFYSMIISHDLNVSPEKISVAHLYTKSGGFTNPITYSSQMIASFEREVINEVYRIKEIPPNGFKPRINQFCNWCDYKGLCYMHTPRFTIESNLKTWVDHKKQLELIQEAKEKQESPQDDEPTQPLHPVEDQ